MILEQEHGRLTLGPLEEGAVPTDLRVCSHSAKVQALRCEVILLETSLPISCNESARAFGLNVSQADRSPEKQII